MSVQHRLQFDPHFTKRRGHEVVTLVAGDERHISNRRKFSFEFFLGIDPLGGLGQLFEIGGCARDR